MYDLTEPTLLPAAWGSMGHTLRGRKTAKGDRGVLDLVGDNDTHKGALSVGVFPRWHPDLLGVVAANEFLTDEEAKALGPLRIGDTIASKNAVDANPVGKVVSSLESGQVVGVAVSGHALNLDVLYASSRN